MAKEIALVRPGESVSVEEYFLLKSSSITFWSEVRESPQKELGKTKSSSPGLVSSLTVNTL